MKRNKEKDPAQQPQTDVVPAPQQPSPEPSRVAQSLEQEAQVYVDADKKKPAQNSRDAVGVFGWLGIVLLMLIPIINIIFVFRWAFSKKINLNKKNYAIATLIIWGVLLVVGIVLAFAVPHFYEPLINALAVLFMPG